MNKWGATKCLRHVSLIVRWVQHAAAKQGTPIAAASAERMVRLAIAWASAAQ